jgi:hypothetical protein
MGSFELMFDGTPADPALFDGISLIEVEENVDMPSAMQIVVPVNRDEHGDLTLVSDSRLAPLVNVAFVASAGGGTRQCLFDGYILSHKLHLEAGVTASTLQVWSQDATWLMNLEEKVKEWVDVTDADVAASIFGDYGISPAAGNSEDDSPSHTEDKHTLMQRGSDIQFLRMLARRNGKLCRVTCDDQPGRRTGTFARPALGGEPELTIVANDLDAPTVAALDFEWDVTRPSAVKARQALFDDAGEDGVGAELDDGGLELLSRRSLGDFAGKPMTVLLAAPVDDAGELTLRAQSVLREAGWFVRCEGETDAARLGAILRAGTIVRIDAAGALNSGNYFVWSVRHSITTDGHRMRFVLVRNAVGATS